MNDERVDHSPAGVPGGESRPRGDGDEGMDAVALGREMTDPLVPPMFVSKLEMMLNFTTAPKPKQQGTSLYHKPYDTPTEIHVGLNVEFEVQGSGEN